MSTTSTLTTPTGPVVLVAGSWLGAWAWDRVVPLLRAAGRDVHAVSLTGLGDRAHLGGPHVDLALHVEDVVAVLERHDLRDAVLVGHSYAATVVTAVASRVPQRIGRLVLLDATSPGDGESLFDIAPPQLREIMEAVAAEHDGWRLPFLSDEQLDAFYGDHALTPEDRRWLRAHVADQPIGTFRQAVPRDAAALAALPRTFVRCTGTPGAAPIAPGQDGWDVAELPTGHWPMVTLPQETAALLGTL